MIAHPVVIHTILTAKYLFRLLRTSCLSLSYRSSRSSAFEYILTQLAPIMSRHNRRRTRGGHKTTMSVYRSSIDLSTEPPLDPGLPYQSIAPITKTVHSLRNGPTARHWHNRYMAWQARERRQREEKDNLEAEKRRIFGEADGGNTDGEDDILCEKMLEYFVGLDFIDP